MIIVFQNGVNSEIIYGLTLMHFWTASAGAPTPPTAGIDDRPIDIDTIRALRVGGSDTLVGGGF